MKQMKQTLYFSHVINGSSIQYTELREFINNISPPPAGDVNISFYYDEFGCNDTITISWNRLETDEEMSTRNAALKTKEQMKRKTAAEKRKKKREADIQLLKTLIKQYGVPTD